MLSPNTTRPTPVLFDEFLQHFKSFAPEIAGTRVPNDRAISGPPIAIEQVILVESLLIQAEHIKRQSPRFQRCGQRLKLAVLVDDVAGGILPLVGDDQQKAVRPTDLGLSAKTITAQTVSAIRIFTLKVLRSSSNRNAQVRSA